MRTALLAATAALLTVTTPATAADTVNARTAVTFAPSVWSAFKAEGVAVDTVGAAARVESRSFAFGCTKKSRTRSRGGLVFTSQDASLTMRKFIVNLRNQRIDVTIPGVGKVKRAFDLTKVRSGKRKMRAVWKVADGRASALNRVLETKLFTDGMTMGRVSRWLECAEFEVA
ncbi:MAG: hypothetical protein R2720_07270 [Candidatus Nanopelagicales bacterium]